MRCSVGRSAICILLLACIAPRIQGIAWLKGWSGWGSSSSPPTETSDDSDESNQEDLQDELDLDDFDPEHVPFQLASVVCPAASGMELKDYWRCLWGYSLTPEGMEQERRGLVDAFYEAAKQKPEPGYFVRKKQAEMMKQRQAAAAEQEKVQQATGPPGTISPKGEGKEDIPKPSQNGDEGNVGGTDSAPEDWEGEVDITTVDENGAETNVVSSSDVRSKRVKRQSEGDQRAIQEVKELSDLGFKKIAKIAAWDTDLESVIRNPAKAAEVRKCQEDFIKPGVSLTMFIVCLRDKSNLQVSRLPEVQDPPYPEVDITYDPREFPLLDLDLGSDKEDEPSDQDEKYTLRFDYDRIKADVDEVTDFNGADPYLLEQVGDFRYRFDNLGTNQQSPAWSYIGEKNVDDWHKQELKKFFIPLRSNADLKKAAFLADLAQTYPGLGEIAAQSDKLETPMNYGWQKDSGYHAHTRYLLPLLVNADLAYFKHKKLIDESVTLKPDSEVIGDIIQSLEYFLKDTSLPIDDEDNYPTVEDIPFLQTYRDFLVHYYGVDVSSYIQEKTKYLDYLRSKGENIPLEYNPTESDVRESYDLIRLINRHYVEAVLAQQKCVKDLVEKYDHRREGEDVDDLLKHAKELCILPTGSAYQVPGNYLRELYQQYYDRKEARQAYSLPVYPTEFPLCQHNEQSPIDIITSKGRDSALREYEFGDAGYRLNRFYMAIPNDGTPLLSIGILNGERLDDSSVKLTGGAVKGQNLAFQYMFLRMAKDWEKVGSEHRFDGKGAPVEIQMLFTLAGSTDDIKYWHILARVQNQLYQYRGKLVIILSVLVDVLIDDDAVIKTIKEKKTNQDPYVFEPLAQAAYHFWKQWDPRSDVPRGYVSKDPTFRLTDFIPKEEATFYTYRGSLSWPPCFGYVLWSVYDKRLYMSKRQFDQFARIPAFGITDSGQFAENFREPGKIIVGEEEIPGLSYEDRQALINKRTVDRYVLKGKHIPDLTANKDRATGLVDEFGYHDTGSSQAATVPNTGCLIMMSVVTLLLFGLA